MRPIAPVPAPRANADRPGLENRAIATLLAIMKSSIKSRAVLVHQRGRRCDHPSRSASLRSSTQVRRAAALGLSRRDASLQLDCLAPAVATLAAEIRRHPRTDLVVRQLGRVAHHGPVDVERLDGAVASQPLDGDRQPILALVEEVKSVDLLRQHQPRFPCTPT
jgi:hypothetical protein